MPPQDVKILFVGWTEAVLSWKPIPCRHQNGKIIHYLVNYHDCLPTKFGSRHISTTVENKFGITLDNLNPNTRYVIKLAGVNAGGTGPFTFPISFITGGGRQEMFYYLFRVLHLPYL